MGRAVADRVIIALLEVKVHIIINMAVQADKWCYTDFETLDFSCSWTINKYRILEQTKNYKDTMESPPFSAGRFQWSLLLAPKGNSYEDKYVHLGMRLMAGAEKNVLLTFSLSVQKSNGDKVLTRKRAPFACANGGRPSFSNFIQKSVLLDESHGLLPNDQLTIFCEGTVHFVSDTVDTTSPQLPKLTPMNSIQSDLSSLLQDGTFADVTIEVGGTELKAHKAILAARSSVFHAMFEHKMEESLTSRVKIEDIDKEAVKEMLTFMYTDEAPNLSRMQHTLLSLANKYNLVKLKAMCERELCTSLATENVVDVLVLADQHDASQLKDACFRFIAGHTPEVMKLHSWDNVKLQHKDLYIELLEKALLKLN